MVELHVNLAVGQFERCMVASASRKSIPPDDAFALRQKGDENCDRDPYYNLGSMLYDYRGRQFQYPDMP